MRSPVLLAALACGVVATAVHRRGAPATGLDLSAYHLDGFTPVSSDVGITGYWAANCASRPADRADSSRRRD